MDDRNTRLWFILGLSIGLLVCIIASSAIYYGLIKPRMSTDNIQTETIIAEIITGTAQPSFSPTSIITPILPTNTQLPQTTVTQMSTEGVSTPIADGLIIRANLDTNCRSGPDTAYAIMGHFKSGQTSEVIGSNSSQTWWYIVNPDNSEGFCWVWGETTSIEGDTFDVAVITPPAPPPPDPSFSASFEELRDCWGSPYAVFKIVNDGEVKLESFSMLLVNTTDQTNLSYVPLVNYPFWSSNKMCMGDWNYMDPGDTAYVGGEIIALDFFGDKAEARIQLCTEENLEGKCVDRVVSFTMPYD